MSWTYHPELLATPLPSTLIVRRRRGRSAVRSSLTLVAVFGLVASPATAASEAGIWVPVCGNHPPVQFPVPGRGKREMPQGCHAGCAAAPEKKKRLASG